jgi:hypothetical protein
VAAFVFYGNSLVGENEVVGREEVAARSKCRSLTASCRMYVRMWPEREEKLTAKTSGS